MLMGAMVIARTNQFTTTVTSVEALSPRMRRIRLTTPDIARTPWPLGCDIAIVLRSDADDREVRRRYTVRKVEGDTLTVDAVLHGHGPGSSWAAAAAEGDTVTFFGPRGSVDLPEPESTGTVLALTDESGLPAVACVAEVLDWPMIVLAEVADENEQYPLPSDVRSRWLLREDRPAGHPELLAAALDEFSVDLDVAYAYVLGESRAIVALRDELVRFGLDRKHVYAKGYWNLNARPTR